jgi:regulator of ribonuclease activity A
MKIDIRATNTSQVKSIKHNSGEIDWIAKFGGVDFIPGDYIYVDSDGIPICKYDLIHKILKNER